MFKKTFFLFLALSFFLFIPSVSYADDREDLEKQITEYTQKLSELGTAKNTLANQIKILSSQYELTLLRITQTENSIKNLEKEIDSLTVEIDGLNTKLNKLSSLYVLQIIENYKLQKKVPPFAFLFSSDLNNFLEQFRYVSSLQTNSQNSLINMETVRYNYDTQKTAKEKKQIDKSIVESIYENLEIIDLLCNSNNYFYLNYLSQDIITKLITKDNNGTSF
jgi:septal ring factor EnvC (AmiA/AmiB activator)